MVKVSSQRSKSSKKTKSRDSTKAPKSQSADPSTLLVEAAELLQIGNPEAALPPAQQALALLPQANNSQYALPTFNLIAQIEIELGDAESARTHFLAAVELDPEGRESEELGGGAEKFLWLAQLSEDGGKDSISWFERGAAILEREISEQDKMDTENDRRQKLASTLCGMIEVWMTDLSLEPEAESSCESLITRALLLSDPPLPSTLQTLASVRLSQSRLEDAQSALQRSLEQWKDLPTGHPAVPDFPARISLTRLLMEAEMEELASEAVERLVGEDDQSVEAWYLGGWCLWLMGNKEEADAEDRHALLMSSREWLRNCLKLYGLLDYEDERLRDHANELVQGLDQELGDAEIEEEDEEWIDEEDIEDTGDEDHEMNDT